MARDEELEILENNLKELLESYVDPSDALRGPDGDLWNPIATKGHNASLSLLEQPPYRTWQEHQHMRIVGKYLANHNGYARNAHETRKNYIIGKGHVYSVTKSDPASDKEAVKRVSKFLKEWQKRNRWLCRQEEIRERCDRDGETFIRKFNTDGYLILRYVEPADIIEPPQDKREEGYDYSFGIQTPVDDVETIIAYWVQNASGDGEFVPADQIQHRKENCDSSLKRGIPLLYPIRYSLNRAVQILKNNSLAIKIQTAIAMIRKHKASKEVTRTFLTTKAKDDLTSSAKTKPDNISRYQGGSIVDAHVDTEYEFPKTGIDPEKSVKALHAELRLCAVAIQFTEYMFSGDASNNNRASSETAETPTIRRFHRDQERTADADLELIEEAVKLAEENGILMPGDFDQVSIEATPPDIEPRDKLKETQVMKALKDAGVMSPQTMAAKSNLLYEDEQNSIEEHEERNGSLPPNITREPVRLPAPDPEGE